jgi:hypothetical protein
VASWIEATPVTQHFSEEDITASVKNWEDNWRTLSQWHRKWLRR